MARIGVVVGCHLDARVPELRTACVDAALLHNGVTEELAQLVHFLPRKDPLPLQPSL
jgi:cytochrome c peroxidase